MTLNATFTAVDRAALTCDLLLNHTKMRGQYEPPKRSKELENATYDDWKRQEVDSAKKRAVAQYVDYDTFKNMVLVAHLKPIGQGTVNVGAPQSSVAIREALAHVVQSSVSLCADRHSRNVQDSAAAHASDALSSSSVLLVSDPALSGLLRIEEIFISARAMQRC